MKMKLIDDLRRRWRGTLPLLAPVFIRWLSDRKNMLHVLSPDPALEYGRDAA